MELTVLGSSGTAPRRDNPASGYLVATDATRVWMDAGPGTYMALLHHVEPSEIDAVLLSHMHSDHCTDLFALFHGRKYVSGLENPVPVIAPDGAIERLLGFVGGDPDHALFAALAIHIAQPGERFQFGDLAVTAQAAHHSVPALAYRLESGGSSLGYTGDTGPSALVASHFAAADTLLAESSLRTGDEYPFHMNGRQAGEMAAAANVRRLLLTHIPEMIDPQEARAAAAGAFSGEIGLAEPGDVYKIGSADREGE